MIKARFLRARALSNLRSSIPENLNAYRSGDFSHLITDASYYIEQPFEYDPAALSGLVLPDKKNLHDVENCQIVYSALSGLQPYEARDERFWVYLTHTYMLDYARKRWPIPKDKDDAVKHIRQHFFAGAKRDIERDNAASRLWWMAHLCSRVDGLDLPTCLAIFLRQSDVRASIIERPTTAQSERVFAAIIRKLAASNAGKGELFARQTFRELMRLINSVGGVRLLEVMPAQRIDAVLDELIEKRLGLQAL